jgi:hypothetical protein
MYPLEEHKRPVVAILSGREDLPVPRNGKPPTFMVGGLMVGARGFACTMQWQTADLFGRRSDGRGERI